MSNSRSFDRAASFYDQTRPLPDPVAKEGIQAIMDIVGAGSRLLEVGAGTGRISIPLLERGVDLIGCDLSAKMLRRLQEKSPAARIAQADAALLPLQDGSFDFVMTVHVLHLIPLWREAIREFRRVLRPGGAYLNVKTWAPVETTIRDAVRNHWRMWLEAQGVDAKNPGLQGSPEFIQEMQSLGAQVTEMEIIRYPLRFTLSQELERFANRVYSNAWDIPDELFDKSLEDLRTWVIQEYRNLDQTHEDQLCFAIEVVHFDR